jgi:cytochrome c553
MAASDASRTAAITNKAAAGGAANGGGPHNDSALDLIADGYWDGTGTTPLPSYEIGTRYGCFTRRCHATNPHGAGGSEYKIMAAKLLFNESANEDELGDGTYGGLDAVWDDLGATDAAVERFVSANASIMSTTAAGDILIHGAAPDANETHALVAGMTCGRPSNPSTGEDECHAEASYAIVDKGIHEQRNHATGITAGSAYRTDNTGAEAPGYGGNDNRDWKTGHVAGTFAAVPGSASYSPIAGCTSCHDQKDFGNTVAGNYTFPHGQMAFGGSNLTTDGVNPIPATPYNPAGNPTNVRSRIWAGYGGFAGSALTYTAGTNQKAYDGQCLKCHRDGAGAGIGLTK